MSKVLAPFLFPGSDDPNNPNNRCTIPPSQGNYWQTPLFTNAQAMTAYWRVRKWRIDINVSGEVTGSIGCDVQMDATDELELVCGRVADGYAFTEMQLGEPGPGGITPVFVQLFAAVNAFGIGIELIFSPDEGDSFINWGTTNSSGPNQIVLTMGNTTKILAGQYTAGILIISATGTMEPVEWWSYGGTYDTSTGARL
jgi:hypothetical protein